VVQPLVSRLASIIVDGDDDDNDDYGSNTLIIKIMMMMITLFTELHCVTPRKTEILAFTPVRTSNINTNNVKL
jgi:hypothetical protein